MAFHSLLSEPFRTGTIEYGPIEHQGPIEYDAILSLQPYLQLLL